MEYRKRRTWAEISLDNLIDNDRLLARLAAPARVMAVLKANAYGHGAIPVASALEREGCVHFAVATLEEAIELRESGNCAQILVLGAADDPMYVHTAAKMDITLPVFDACHAGELASKTGGIPLKVQWKVDTGLGRYGYTLREGTTATAVNQARQIAATPGIFLTGVWTHMACANMPQQDEYTAHQLALFDKLVRGIRAAGLDVKFHCANSPTVLRFPHAHYDFVRPGNALYGFVPYSDIPFKPVLALKSRILYIHQLQPGDSLSYGRLFTAQRPTKVAIIPFGYADGIQRCASNRMQALVHGIQVPSIGKFCMDCTALDITDVPQAAVGDTVTIVGTEGGRTLRVEDITGLYPGSGPELTTVLGMRIPRFYV